MKRGLKGCAASWNTKFHLCGWWITAFDDAVDAFTRINTLGVRLKVEDIESAKVAARHSGFIADEVVPFLENLRHHGFTRLNVMHLFRACAFVAQPDGRSRTPLHELERKRSSAGMEADSTGYRAGHWDWSGASSGWSIWRYFGRVLFSSR